VPIPTIAITAAVPMMMASAVNKDLSKLALIASIAEFIDSSMIIF
jgi:hypothetical protein